MNRRDQRPVLVVTGATGGIGREISRRGAALGYDIVAQYNAKMVVAEELAEEVRDLGGRCWTVQADLASRAGVLAVYQCVEDVLARSKVGELRGLVNNAAKLLGPSFDEATFEEFDTYFAINTRAAFFLSQQLSRLMAPGGSLVNISSASAHFSSPGDMVYAMTKAAIESMTRNMAEAVAPLGLRVNAVVPGFTDNGHDAFAEPRALEYMSGFAVLGGVSTPANVADAVLFLLSDAASRTTGAVLDVSGGSTLGARGQRAHSIRELL